MSGAVAAAPCSVGIGGDPDGLVGPDRLAASAADAGYAGLDLGPPGYLDAGRGLAARLEERGLGICGAWTTIGEAGTADALAFALDACDASTGLFGDLPAPRPTLAAPEPAGARLGAPVRLVGDDWHRLMRQIGDAAAQCRARGYEPVFHPHVATAVETPEDTDRFLEDTDIDLCFDPGHVALGGGDDVLGLLDRWRQRVTHLHLKNVRMDLVGQLRDSRAEPGDTWHSGVFSPLDAGDLDLTAVLARMRGFGGWVVIEQDAAVPDDAAAARALDDQRRNLGTLRRWGW